MKQKELSRWLRAVVAVGWCACVLLSVWILPTLAQETAMGNPEYAYLVWPSLAVCWIGLIVVAVALWFAWLIFGEIGRDNSFCRKNAKRLSTISHLALADTVLCLISIVLLIVLNAMHPGLLLLALLIAAIGAGIAAAAAALSHLTLKAALLQEENDLTV